MKRFISYDKLITAEVIFSQFVYLIATKAETFEFIAEIRKRPWLIGYYNRPLLNMKTITRGSVYTFVFCYIFLFT